MIRRLRDWRWSSMPLFSGAISRTSTREPARKADKSIRSVKSEASDRKAPPARLSCRVFPLDSTENTHCAVT